MEEPSGNIPPSESQVEARGDGAPSLLTRAGRFVAAHPAGIGHTLLLVLVAVVVLQNLEPTSIDFLFWTVAEIPKLVILLLAMVVGGVLWEVIRRRLRR